MNGLSPALAARGLKSVAELAALKPHGVRLRYMAGCRCDLCRKANSSYENERQKARRRGDWNGIVPAAAARAHMRMLSRQGLGRRAIHAITDVSETVLQDIRAGRKKAIRARTERKILAVTKALAADGAYIDAAPTKRLIAALVDEGYTKRFLAKKLGYKSPALQFNFPQITVLNAGRIRRLHRELTT